MRPGRGLVRCGLRQSAAAAAASARCRTPIAGDAGGDVGDTGERCRRARSARTRAAPAGRRSTGRSRSASQPSPAVGRIRRRSRRSSRPTTAARSSPVRSPGSIAFASDTVLDGARSAGFVARYRRDQRLVWVHVFGAEAARRRRGHGGAGRRRVAVAGWFDGTLVAAQRRLADRALAERGRAGRVRRAARERRQRALDRSARAAPATTSRAASP